MDSKKQSELVDKYWKGLTSREEEEALKNSDLKQLAEEEQPYFGQLQAFSKLKLEDSFKMELAAQLETKEPAVVRPLIPVVFWKIAAIFLLAFGCYYLWTPNEIQAPEPLAVVEEDPEKAFEITKQALLLVSAKLNRANELNVALDKFATAQSKIKGDQH